MPGNVCWHRGGGSAESGSPSGLYQTAFPPLYYQIKLVAIKRDYQTTQSKQLFRCCLIHPVSNSIMIIIRELQKDRNWVQNYFPNHHFDHHLVQNLKLTHLWVTLPKLGLLLRHESRILWEVFSFQFWCRKFSFFVEIRNIWVFSGTDGRFSRVDQLLRRLDWSAGLGTGL